MLGNIGGSTCFCLYRNTLWMYAMVPVTYWSIELWNRVAVGSGKRIELKDIFLFSYFGVRISIYFLFFDHRHSYFSYFLSVIGHLTPWKCYKQIQSLRFLCCLKGKTSYPKEISEALEGSNADRKSLAKACYQRASWAKMQGRWDGSIMELCESTVWAEKISSDWEICF